MTSEEITKAGITSGCKKVLKAVVAARTATTVSKGRDQGKKGTGASSSLLKTSKASKKRPAGVAVAAAGAGPATGAKHEKKVNEADELGDAQIEKGPKQARISSFFAPAIKKAAN